MVETIRTFVKKPFFKVLISVSILALLLLWLPFEELRSTLQKISFLPWFLVLCGFIVAHTVGAVKWRLVMDMGKGDLPLFVAIRYYFMGLFANLFLPSLAGGDIVKAGLAIRFTKKKTMMVLGTMIDRMIDTTSVIFIIIVSGLLSPQFLRPQDQRIVLWIVVLLLGASLIGILFLAIPLKHIKNEKVKRVIKRIKQTLLEVYKNPIRPLIAFGLSLCIQSGFILLTVYLGLYCGIQLPIVIWFLVWPLAKLSALLPISLGGIGVREVALATLLGRFGISIADSVALGLLWDSFLIVGGIFGLILFLVMNYITRQKEPFLLYITQLEEEDLKS